jgi:hypothetical protein
MKTRNNYFLVLTTSALLSPVILSWGVFGHEHINHAAVLNLPDPLRVFFYNHIDFVTQESTVPDLRKYTLGDKNEFPRHYIDLENYGNYDSLPKTLVEVQKKYEPEFLMKNGILPWYINAMMEKLTKAFKEKRKTEILFLAGDLGHYIGDAHMPLHTTENHDGQLTDQRGIHAFWETQLPELFGSSYQFKFQDAVYIKDIAAETKRIIFGSHDLISALLTTDQQLKKDKPLKEIYKTGPAGEILKNKFNQPIHNDAYASQYNKALNGMVEKQLCKAVEATSSYWYTAWVNAGKPDLSDLDAPELTTNNKTSLQKELQLKKDGKMGALNSEKEFY